MSDISVTDANVLASSVAQVQRAIAGAAVERGQPIYLDSADGYSAKPADADAATTAVAVGIALNQADDGQPVDYVVEDPSFTPGGTTVPGTIYCVSTNAGGIAPWADLASGDFVTVLGVGLASNKLALKINVSGEDI